MRHPQLESEQVAQIRDHSTTVRAPGPDVHQRGKYLLLFALAAAVVFVLTKVTITVLHSTVRGLPYSDRFETGDNADWSAYGGNWKIEAGSMVNESDERGAKLVAGSPYWTDYTVQADVALRSPGEAGLIARVSDPEQGVDAYRGNLCRPADSGPVTSDRGHR